MTIPKVSVIMPVYNGERYLRAAINSILNQSYRNFELIIINDGSTDSSANIIESYDDNRIVFANLQQNTGLANVRNKGLEIAQGDYIAWLDCDDISLPVRLEKQINLLDANPGIGLCGTWVKTIDGAKEEIWHYPIESELIRARMLFDDPIATSSIMMRASCVRQPELRFNLDYPPAEDYELWERISRDWGVINIPEILTLYRIHPAQTSVLKVEKQKAAVWKIQNNLLSQLGIQPSELESQIHLGIGAGWCFEADLLRIEDVEHWLLKIESENEIKGLFPKDALRKVLAERWFYVCRGASRFGIETWRRFNGSPLRKWCVVSRGSRIRLLLRSLIRW